jgi:hypothetical protein
MLEADCSGLRKIWAAFLMSPAKDQTNAVMRAAASYWVRVLVVFACPQQRGDAAITVAAVLAGQGKDGPDQGIFVIPLCRLVALRAPRLIHQLARSPLTDATLLPRMAHRTTPPFRA